MSEMRVIVITSDNYLPAIRPFAYLFNKYWSPAPSVLLAGFSEPEFDLPENFSFVSMGEMKDYPWDNWSNAVIQLLNEIDDEAFTLMLEDYWIVRHVDAEAVKMLYDYALQFKYVLKVDLCGDRLYAFGADLNYGYLNRLDLIKSMPGSPYHMSLMPGIWRKDNLLRAMIPNESPHSLEMEGTTRVSHMQDLLVLGTRQWPLRITLGLRARDYATINLTELNKEDIKAMVGLGYFRIWEDHENG